jgi:cyclase
LLTKRIIPCLDIKDGRTVKGVNFINIRDAGDPVELGASYANQGADELVFLDIAATTENRKTFVSLVRQVARHVNIPFTVGGGISSVADVAPLLEAGADKVSINSAAVRNPQLIDDLARGFGSQFVVVAIDAEKITINGLFTRMVEVNQLIKNYFHGQGKYKIVVQVKSYLPAWITMAPNKVLLLIL